MREIFVVVDCCKCCAVVVSQFEDTALHKHVKSPRFNARKQLKGWELLGVKGKVLID
jgi:hypothetical protein